MEDAYVLPENPRLKAISTIVIVAGSLLTAITFPRDSGEVAMYKFCAVTLFLTFGAAFAIEGMAGLRSLIRVDIVALTTIYFLTFAEFLHPHVRVLYKEETGGGAFACQLVIIGLCCITIGRHIKLFSKASTQRAPARLPDVSPNVMINVFFVLAFLGYLYPLIKVDFNIVDLFTSLVKPRFDRPWQRAAIGDWTSALTELALLLYICAALGGFILGNAKQFSPMKRGLVIAILLFMLWFDFTDGTRNVVLIKGGLFMVTFFISNKRAKGAKIFITSILMASSLWLVSGYMLDFRNEGVGTYLSGQHTADTTDDDDGGFMIDNNMVSIARVTQVFPSAYPFPGWDIVIQVATKWIPRFLWEGKPTGWTTSIEDALNLRGYTLAVTYIGEAYLIAGIPSLVIISLLIGALASAWTRVGIAARSNLDLIYYASGFYAATLSMRSIQWASIAMVPTIAFYVFARIFIRRSAKTKQVYRSQSA